MKTYVKYSILALAALLVVSLVVCGGMSLPARAGVVTVTVSGSSFTSTYAGACEGGWRFDVNDLIDSNVASYRLYGGLSRWEYEDDDGVYGSPTIAEIKADPDAVNWAWWDNAMNNPPGGSDYFWMPGTGAQVTAAEIFAGLKANGIMPLVTLRPTDNNDNPAWGQALNPPTSPDDWNEWWEHVFAVVYWLNVRNDYQVDDWQVHNEPDSSSQGWFGTVEDYYLLAEYMVDAIDHVYSTYLPGRTYHIYAPVGVNYAWQEEVLTNIPDLFDVMDFHTYDSSITGKIEGTYNNIAQYGGGRTYSIEVSEWGSYRDDYDSVSYGVKTIAANMVRSARAEWLTRGTHIFSMYNWGTNPRYSRGLIDTDGTRRDGYYGFRLAARGIGGERTGYETTASSSKFIVATTMDDSGVIYVTIVNTGSSATVDVDVSALISSGTATHWEYSASNMDVVVGNPTVSNGLVTINVPSTSASLLVIGGGSPPPTATPAPPTDTPVPPTDTPIPPTDTPVPPTNTPGGPTDTPAPPPTDTPAPPPTDTPGPTNTPGSGGNLALGRPVTASTVKDDNVPELAVDGDMGTQWRTIKIGRKETRSWPEWLIVDLGASYSVSQVVIEWNGDKHATTYEIQVSTNGADWTTVYSTTSGDGYTDTINFSSTSAAHVQLYTTAWNQEWEGNWVLEFEVYE